MAVFLGESRAPGNSGSGEGDSLLLRLRFMFVAAAGFRVPWLVLWLECAPCFSSSVEWSVFVVQDTPFLERLALAFVVNRLGISWGHWGVQYYLTSYPPEARHPF